MKKIRSIFLIAIFFAACTPDRTNPNIAGGTFQYKVNGNLVIINNDNISNGEYATFFKQLAGSLIPHTRYMLNGQKGANHVWVFGIQTDSLTIRNYTYDTTYLATSGGTLCTMVYNGQQSALFYAGDNLNINITSHSSGHISGNFTAKFTPFGSIGTIPVYSARGTTIITEGQFDNIKCTY